MNYISEIFDRLDIQHIREFLLHGAECMEISNQTYKQRIDEARNPATEMIKKKFPQIDEYEKITNEIYGYANTVEDVYMEIGMQCGAVLVMQLLGNTQAKNPLV